MEDKNFDSINVIPLVDVMMVLLTIVLMTSTFIVSGIIPVELPRITRDEKAAMKTLTIVIDRTGTIYLESTPLTLSLLKEKLSSVRKDTPVMVRADRNIPVQLCVDVLDLLASCGFKKVGLQTERSG
jgi:biopolymer transport protein ExbD